MVHSYTYFYPERMTDFVFRCPRQPYSNAGGAKTLTLRIISGDQSEADMLKNFMKPIPSPLTSHVPSALQLVAVADMYWRMK